MKNIHLLLGTILGTFALIGVVVYFLSSGESPQMGGQIELSKLMEGAVNIKMGGTSASATASAETSESTAEAEPSEQAQEKVTIVEFSDFQCPACRAAQPLVEQVFAQYPNDVQLVYRHFPLDSIHPNARAAAVASEAVGALDRELFWPYHDRLFTEQQTWGSVTSRTELAELFATYAQEIGIDKTQFLEKMEDTTLTQLVAQDTALGMEIGVNSTPTFFVNGVPTTMTGLAAAVQAELEQGE